MAKMRSTCATDMLERQNRLHVLLGFVVLTPFYTDSFEQWQPELIANLLPCLTVDIVALRMLRFVHSFRFHFLIVTKAITFLVVPPAGQNQHFLITWQRGTRHEIHGTLSPPLY